MEKDLVLSSDNNIHIFYSCNDGFIQHLCASVASVLHSSGKTDSLNFYILNNNISQENKNKVLNLKKIKNCNIEFIDVNEELFKNCPLNKAFPHLTVQSYYRFIIADIKPTLDKAIYLDCDTVVIGSLSELWDTELGEKYCGVVQDMNPYGPLEDAKRLNIDAEFNAGVMLINMKKWNEDAISHKLFEKIKELSDKNILQWLDQDALNCTFDKKVLWISPMYNYQQTAKNKPFYTKYTEKDINHARTNVVVIHYNGQEKPWKERCDFYDIEYYKSLFIAGWKYEALRLFFENFIIRPFFRSYKEGEHCVYKICGIKIKTKEK